MSNIAPEGAPTPIADVPAPSINPPAPVNYFSQAPAKGLQTSHVAGGGFGGVVGAVVVAVCSHLKIHVSVTDATIIGAAAVSAGVGVGHVVAKVGVAGAVKALWRGNR